MKHYAGGLRWSQSERAWCGLFTYLPDGRIGCGYELTWYRKTPEFAAAALLKFCRDERIVLDYVVAQPEIFPKTDEVGETVSETFSRCGVPIRKGSGDRLACWSRVRSWLEVRDWPDGSVGPALRIHPGCVYLTDSIPALVKSETEPDDVDETPDEYPAMGLALYAMSRPSPWIQPEVKKPLNPLSGAYLWNELRNGASGEARYVGWNRHRL